MLGVGVATFGVVVMTVLVWIIYRSRAPGHGLIEYVVMFPQAVPRLVFGLALLWAWLNIPIPIYGTLWLLALAYFTVLMPLGVRTLAGVMLQIDKSLEECARVCGASWGYQLRTVTMPLLRPGIVAAWLLLFIASVRELGVSIFLVGPNAQGHRAVDRQRLAQLLDRAVDRTGDHSDGRSLHGARHSVPRDPRSSAEQRGERSADRGLRSGGALWRRRRRSTASASRSGAVST